MARDRKMYEFRSMSRREKWKIEVFKLFSLGMILYALYAMVFLDLRTSAQLANAAGVMSFSYVYFNLFRVNSEIVELFEPPYDVKGNGIVVLVVMFSIASIYFVLNAD